MVWRTVRDDVLGIRCLHAQQGFRVESEDSEDSEDRRRQLREMEMRVE